MTISQGWIRMKKALYVFNPENDLALADGSWNYTAPKHAKKIRDDLQLLPVWFAEAGSVVLADNNKINVDFLKEVKQKFSSIRDVTIFNSGNSIDRIYPWGWSLAICYQIKQIVEDAPMPSVRLIDEFRNISHRRTSLRILEGLDYDGVLPEECYSLEDVVAFLNNYGNCIVKAPWSSSGKGVFLVSKSNLDAYKPLIVGFIKKQGSVICEKFLNKVLDFAMEFKAENGNLSFVGLSVFESNSRFSYDRAVVGSYDILLSKIVRYIPLEELETLKLKAINVLSSMLPKEYNGYLGLDMMAFVENDEYKIMPCIELNLRTTMGFLASLIGENIIEKGKEGQMSILYHKSHEDLVEFVGGLEPPVIVNGRLEDGAMLLVPVYSDSLFTAVIEIV